MMPLKTATRYIYNIYIKKAADLAAHAKDEAKLSKDRSKEKSPEMAQKKTQ